jgi:bifunctional DNA-binding transcriptional regulator/antitoxin component of YhaV-PrlF toxin-antitoxin module
MYAVVTIDLNIVQTIYRIMSLVSSVGIAKIGTRSLRTTVPEGIVAFMGIKEGDKLEWKMDIQSNERMSIVKKSPTKDDVELARFSMKNKRKSTRVV